MLFNSYFFLCVFLPATLLGFYLFGRYLPAASTAWLIVTSLFFYGWWNPRYLALLCISIVLNYLFGVSIDRARRQAGFSNPKLFLICGVVFNLGLLGYYKYAAFMVRTYDNVAHGHFAVPSILLPLAISFFTFTQIAYLVDAYHGVTAEYDFWHYVLFVTFFPHLIAGPIVAYRRLGPQFAQRGNFRLRLSNCAPGFSLFILGLAKKVLIADNLAPLSQATFDTTAAGGSPTLLLAALGTTAYALQIYFDFSGYSDMAVGLARMFNIQFPLNFNSPYKSASVTDFWRRWHISLSTFLRDHLYIPLGGNRKGSFRTCFNLMATMVLGGLWHGAGWTFCIWGLLHGLYLVVHREWQKIASLTPILNARPFAIAGRALTLLCVGVAWVFFRSHTLGQSITILQSLAGMHGLGLPLTLREVFERHGIHHPAWFAPWVAGDLVGNCLIIGCTGAIALIAPNTEEIMRLADKPQAGPTAHQTSRRIWRPSRRWAIYIGLLLAISIMEMNKLTEFLYFQF